MTWPAALLALLVSHLVGDFLLQTEWQAVNKVRGIGDAESRQALLRHIGTYTLACLPALVWIGHHTSAGRAVATGVLISGTHLLVDDGHLVRAWLRDIKHVERPALGLTVAVDQTFHVVCLLGAALIAAG